MSIKYIKLPIYSVAIFGEYIYFAGGGGGATGIPNQIKIYHRTITPEPTASVDTGRYIIENLTVCESRSLLFCNANEWVVAYQLQDGGGSFKELYRFQADFSPKHLNVNAIAVTPDASTLLAAGEDQRIRVFNLNNTNSPPLVYEHSIHGHQIKAADQNQGGLFLSVDNHLIVVCNPHKKQIVRTLHQDQFRPEKTFFRSAYFLKKESQELVITHFIPRTSTFVTKERGNKVHTMEIAQDQASQTAYQPELQMLGVACANGLTTLVSTDSLQHQGSENYLHAGVNACVISKKRNLISGTSNCSYHVQGPEGSISMPWALFLALLLTSMFVFLSSVQDHWQL